MDLKALHANYQPVNLGSQPAPAKAAPKGGKGLGGFLLRNAPTIGAVGGSLLAAPFTGGLSLLGGAAALGAGAAAGSAIGEASKEKGLEGKLHANEIVKQAAIGGVTSAIPVGGLYKGLKVAAAAKPAAEAAGKSILRPTATSQILDKTAAAGQRLETRAGGYGLGEKMTGRAPVTPQAQKDIQATLKTEAIPKGHPDVQVRTAADKLDNYHNQIDEALNATNKKLSPTQVKQIATDYLNKIKASPTLDKNVLGSANQFAKNLTDQVKDVKGLNAFRRGVDKNAISYIANPDAATAAKTEAAQAMRHHLSDTIGQLAPEVKTVNGKYADLSKATDYLTAQSGRLTRQSENTGGGILGRLLTGDTAQSLKSVSGDKLQQAAGLPRNTLPGLVASNAGREGAKQVIGRPIVGSLLGLNKPADNQAATPTDLGTANPLDTGLTDTTQTAATTDNSPFTQGNIQKAIIAELASGDKNAASNISALASLYKTFGQNNSGLNVTKVTSQNYDNALSGSQSLQQLQQLIGQDPGVVTRTAAPGGSLPVIGGFIRNKAGVGQYDAIGYNIADTLLRIRTGAQANESEIKNLQNKIMPRAGDTPQVINTKLQQIRQAFGSVINQAQNQSSGPDLSALGQ